MNNQSFISSFSISILFISFLTLLHLPGSSVQWSIEERWQAPLSYSSSQSECFQYIHMLCWELMESKWKAPHAFNPKACISQDQNILPEYNCKIQHCYNTIIYSTVHIQILSIVPIVFFIVIFLSFLVQDPTQDHRWHLVVMFL